MSADIKNASSLVTPYFTVRKSSIQGKGAFATKKIRKGQRIIEYIGEKITDEEADRRYDEAKMDRHHTFLFTLNSKIVVDGAVGGNASIFINHSCAPNCEAVIEGKHIYIYALRTIQPGEELLYDYQYELDDESDELANFYKCLCGADNCRGTIMKLSKKSKANAVKQSRKNATKKRENKAGQGGKASKRGKTVGKKTSRKSRKQAVRTMRKPSKQATKRVTSKTTKKTPGQVTRNAGSAAKTGGPAAKKGAQKTGQRSSRQTRKQGTMKNRNTRPKRTRAVR